MTSDSPSQWGVLQEPRERQGVQQNPRALGIGQGLGERAGSEGASERGQAGFFKEKWRESSPPFLPSPRTHIDTGRGREGGNQRERWRRGIRRSQGCFLPHPPDLYLIQRNRTPCVPSPARSSGQELRAGLGLPVASIQPSAPSSSLMVDSHPPPLALRRLGACRSPEVSLFLNQG